MRERRTGGGRARAVARSTLERRLDKALERRLTTVVADAGFGKTTLVAAWARDKRCAWYTASAAGAALDDLARGLIAALQPFVAALAPELTSAIAGLRGPDAAEERRAEAIASLLAAALAEGVDTDVALVVDDADELGDAVASWQLIESLCRQAPPALHVILVSRADPPFPIERLRGRGQVLELRGADLLFSAAETEAHVTAQLGRGSTELAAAIHRATGGWPAAVRLAVEMLESVAPEDRPAVLARLPEPGTPVSTYLAGEVFDAEPAAVRDLVRLAAELPRVTPELCTALGADDAKEVLRTLVQRGLFERPQPGEAWFAPSALVREFAREHLRLDERQRSELHRTAARWFENHDDAGEALRSFRAIGDTDEAARVARERGPELLRRGAADDLLELAGDVPPGDPALEQLFGDACRLRGDWDGALAHYRLAAPETGPVPASLAFRIGHTFHVRGRLDEALAAYERARLDGADPLGEALVLAWRSTVLWLRGDEEGCRRLAEHALERASVAADPQGLAAAHTALAMVAALSGDRTANEAHYAQALDFAERAGDIFQVIRIRTNRGSHHLEEGTYAAALVELEVAIGLADLAGYAWLRGLALTNRAEIHQVLGRLDEALADLVAAKALYESLGSRMVSYPLQKLGDVYYERGNLALARAAYEQSLLEAEASGDVQGLVPTLAGLALVLATDDPDRAAELAERALAHGQGMGYVPALIALGSVALARGDRAAAAGAALEAASTARARRDRAGLAEALELEARASTDPALQRRRLAEAAAVWQEIGNAARVARAEITSAVETPAAAIAIETLGRFRVLRHGAAVPLAEWKSKKARDLLKILVARRGRPATRDYLMETLWPGDDASKLSNRLSVALSTVRTLLDPERRFPPDQFVVAEQGAVALALDHISVDVESFLAAAETGLAAWREAKRDEALDLLLAAESAYTGDFLSEDVYEDWAASAREEARTAYAAVARALAEEAATAGDGNAAARYFLRIIERDAYDEHAHLGLVSSLAAVRRHGDARRAFRQYCARMAEIGVEPAPYPSESGLTAV